MSSLSLRSLGARRQRTLLTTVGVVLGVGIVFGVLTLSETMSSTFEKLFSRAYGAADLTVTAAGGSGVFDEGAVGEVREEPGVAFAAPRLSMPAVLISENGKDTRGMRLFGVEPESAALATGFELTEGRFPESGAELTLDEGSAEEAGLRVGDVAAIGTPGGPEEVELVGLLRMPGGSFGGNAFGMAPLPFVQESFDEPGRISGIAVEASDSGAVDQLKEQLERDLGEGLQAEQSETRKPKAGSEIQSFKVALLFFAGTALFVGAFLVFNALSMTVLERTRELGMLRALGATRAMISRSVILEACILGVVGSALGVLFGYGMAKALVYLFGRAYRFEITELSPSPFAFVSAVVIGIVVTVLAALYPALRAGRVSPVEAMRRGTGTGGGKGRSPCLLAPIGVLLVAVGAPWTYCRASNLSTTPL